MRDKNEIILTPAKSGYGLTDPERLETARLMLKAGYRVELGRRYPAGKTSGLYEYYMIIDKPER